MSFRKRLARWIAGGAPPRRRSFAAARLTRLEADWFTSVQSADQEVKASLVALRKRSRQLVRDNAHAAAFIGLCRADMVGPEGVILHSRIETARGGVNQRLNDEIERAWYEWGTDPDQCDAAGLLTWLDIQHLAVATWATDGEVFLRKRIVSVRGGRPTLALQFIDADQVDETYERRAGPGETEIRMGVEVDGMGRHVAFWVTRGHPAEAGTPKERVRIPAEEMIHCYLPHRPGATRGVPWLTPVMLSLKMLDGYTEAEITAARIAAAKSVMYQQEADSGDPVESGEITEDIEPGMSKVLPPGVTPFLVDPKHPTTAYPEFKKAMLREIAAGAGVAYHSLAGDLEGVNLSSARVGMVQERDQWMARQQALITQLHRRVYRAWLEVAAMNGTVRLPGGDVTRFFADAWVPRRWQSPDPLKDAQTAELLLSRNLASRSDICQREGKDFEDVLAQRQRERELAKQYGEQLNDAPATGAGPQGGGDGGGSQGSGAGDGDGADRPGGAGGDRDGDRGGDVGRTGAFEYVLGRVA